MSHCSQPTCPGGNCPGCRNSQLWCQDSRCAPYCRECEMTPNHDMAVNIILAVLALCLLLGIVFLSYQAYYAH